MDETRMLLFSEQDIEYYKQMSEEELRKTLEQMLEVSHRIAENHSLIENAPWYKRALMTLSGKTKRTQKAIAADHAIVSAYCVQIINEFVNRGLVTQEKVNILEIKVNELYNQFAQLVQLTGTAFHSIEEYSTFILALVTGYYSDTLISALRIYSKIYRLIERREVVQIVLRAIKKYIDTTPKTVAERMIEIQNATYDEVRFYEDFAEHFFNNKVVKVIRICLKLREVDCLDEIGVLKAIENVGLTNKETTLDGFIAYIIGAEF